VVDSSLRFDPEKCSVDLTIWWMCCFLKFIVTYRPAPSLRCSVNVV